MKTPTMLALAVLCTGCASSPYLTNRARDAADIFTATYGANLGAKARVGPVHAGLYYGYDQGGLRGGQFRKDFGAAFGDIVDGDCTLVYTEDFRAYGMTIARERGKQMGGAGYMGLSVGGTTLQPERAASWRINIPYYTQVEVAAGLLVGVRMGFNPGELLDFLLGWTTLDLFDDDVGLLRQTTTHTTTPELMEMLPPSVRPYVTVKSPPSPASTD